MLECWLLYTHLNVLDSQRKDTHEALFLIFLKQYNDWVFLNLPLASTLSPPIFLNYYFLKSIFHLCCPRHSRWDLLGLLFPDSYMIVCFLFCSSQTLPFRFLRMVIPNPSSISFLAQKIWSPASASLLSHWPVATLFTNQKRLGTGTFNILHPLTCRIPK